MTAPSDRRRAPTRSEDRVGNPRRLSADATRRNREPILEVLRRVLPPSGTVLEIASGTGEHAAYFAPRLPRLVWQPSEADARMRDSIDAWRAEVKAPNLMPPVALDVERDDWPLTRAEALVCINMIHITPWSATEGLMRGAGRVLPAGGVLYLYGPYRVGGRHTAPSNAAFDDGLKARHPSWGVRDLGEVAELAAAHGLRLVETVPMPANNLSVVFHMG